MRWAAAGALVLGMVSSAGAQSTTTINCTGTNSVIGPKVGYQQLTVSTVAVALTVPPGSVVAVAVLEGGAIRYRDDGTNPTAGIGMPVAAGAGALICVRELAPFRAIRSGGTDGVLNVSFYGTP